MKPIKANLMILLVTMTWGTSYLFMKIGLETVPSFSLVALRFGIAFLVCAAVFFKQFRSIHFVTLKYGFILGFLLFRCICFSHLRFKNHISFKCWFSSQFDRNLYPFIIYRSV